MKPVLIIENQRNSLKVNENATTKQDYQTKYTTEFNGSDYPFRYPIVVLFRLLVLLNTTISTSTITYYVPIFAGYMLTSDFVPEFVIGHHIIFAKVGGPDEIKRIIVDLTRFCRSLQSIFITKKAASSMSSEAEEFLQRNIQLFITECSNYFRVAYDSQDTSFKDSLLALRSIFEQTHQAVPDDSSLLVGRTKTRTQKGIIVPKDNLKSTIRKPGTKPPNVFDDKFQQKLDKRVTYYIDLLNSIGWNETTLFPLLCELYWETASDPQLNKRKLLIIKVFNAKYIPLDISVRDAMNKFFYTSSNSTMKDEKIISLLFLKFILYFATFILNKDTTKESLLCESLSHLIGLVGSTDGEGILNGGTGSIAAFLKNTKQIKRDLQIIITEISNIFTDRSIAVPDTISIQTIIPEICRIKIQQLCPGGVTDSEKLACPYRYECNRRRDALDSGTPHFAKFSHPPGFKHVEDRPKDRPRRPWRPGGGTGKSTRTKRRRLSSTKRTRRRPSTKRSTKRR